MLVSSSEVMSAQSCSIIKIFSCLHHHTEADLVLAGGAISDHDDGSENVWSEREARRY